MTWCINEFRLPQWLSSKESACWAAGDASPAPGSGRYLGGVYGNPPQCSCLENPIERGVWWAAVQRVTKSRTRLKQLMTHAHKGTHLADSFRTMGGGHLEKVTSGWLAHWTCVRLTLSLVFRMCILKKKKKECAFCPSFLQWEIFPKTTQTVLREQLVQTIWTVYMLEAG